MAEEAFLPFQGCTSLLGARLTATAVQGVLQVAVVGMARPEWQVRKAAAETLTTLAATLQQQQSQRGQTEGSLGAPESGLAALVRAQPQLLAAVDERVRFDRIPKVRVAAAALVQVRRCSWGCVLALGP